MQNNNLSKSDELRQMKSDYEYLKADMDKQMIINRQLMEMVLRNHVSVLDSNRRTTVAGVSAAILITLAASYIKGLDMYLAGMLAIFYVLLLMGYLFIYHRLGKIEYGADDLLSTVTRLRKFKRNYMIVNTVSWVLVIGLMYFIFPEIHNTFRNPERGIAAITFMCVAIFAGICIQYFIDRKVLRACDNIINQLKDNP
ncbi:MAG TPA: hypothetical protein H9834_04700 [Candidatus Barnesiella excrementavium]|nr:hypothetical protein [Candidatus Barnesiella excrementavium]